MLKRYIGRVMMKPGTPQYGFIRLASVKMEDGSPNDLSTSHDIFVHQDDCGSQLRHDADVTFEVIPDAERGGDALRAAEVSELLIGELVLAGDDIGHHAVADPRQLYVQPTRAQQLGMKLVAPEKIEKVLANRPMPGVSRSNARPQDAAEFTRQLMRRLFPQFAALHDGTVDMADESFDEVIRRGIEDHKALGMQAQADHMLNRAKTYKGLRTVLQSEDDLLTPASLIPLRYLPDLFAAVPVWYFWADEASTRIARESRTGDAQIHPVIKDICDMVPGARWADTFLMFNRRMRILADYQGDIIPPKVIARMRKLAPVFDHLVIMTPYHDVAGADWENVAWLRSIDPYVVGFLKGIPLMFVVGRFSDSGTFPLHSELVADTIDFLRANIGKLRGFSRVPNLYWYRDHSSSFFMPNGRLGEHLIQHTRQLLGAFDEGNLFDWLRGEDAQEPAKA